MLLNALATFVNFVLRGAIFLAIAVLGGFGSAWALIHSGSRLTTTTVGPWMSWTAAGKIDADPYTRAHTVRLGSLPINPSLGLTWEARNDADGQRIHSSCAYVIDLSALDAAWWSLSIFDERGDLIPNAANRHAFNAATIVPEPNGAAVVTLARNARPGNWLPTTGAGKLVLVLAVQDPIWVAAANGDPERMRPLPTITRLGCR